MPSALASGSAPARHDDLDNYNVDDFSDNPFASPSPPSSAKKRKERDDGLGISEEVSVQKRARVPNVKLDEERLLSAAGIPTLRTRARDLKLKGKGHEFSDASRLLSFYQLWLDDLFPKAKFLDALAMVEKAGHKKKLMVARNEWINESKSKDSNPDDEAELDTFENTNTRPGANTGEGDTIGSGRFTTPERGVPNDDDLYDGTPRTARPPLNDAPDEDDLDALMAEADTHDRPTAPAPAASASADDDDLDALVAEAELLDKEQTKKAPAADSAPQDHFDDDEAAMQEMDGLW